MAAKTARPLRVKVERFSFQLIPQSESTNIRSLKKLKTGSIGVFVRGIVRLYILRMGPETDW